jgi:hypothetical protein
MELNRNFVKNRHELQNQNHSVPRRSFKMNSKIASLLQVNQNNFLNRGDCGHPPFLSKR